QPIMFVILFRFVFAGAVAMALPAAYGGNYVNFLMPGIFIQTVIFGSLNTGIGLAYDMKGGMVDRFRSLPMARSAVLAGRTTSDIVRNSFVLCLMVIVGYMVGYRFSGNLSEAVLAVVLILLFGHAFSWISAFFSLTIRDPESVEAASFIWVFPLTFASSAFVPAQSMPGWLQTWAEFNPVTVVVNSVRSLSIGHPWWHEIAKACIWIAVLLAAAAPAAVNKFRKLT
ncbi:MAG: ABC transporter permease, partial [Actinobacteria bacterium]|nr:ABC transporter permease [Actinomycetota bacterium]